MEDETPVIVVHHDTDEPPATEQVAEHQLEQIHEEEVRQEVNLENTVSELRTDIWNLKAEMETLKKSPTPEPLETKTETEEVQLIPVEKEADPPKKPRRPFWARILTE